MIVVENLTKVYGRGQPAAVDSVSFEVRNGEIVGFVGLNGAGKTTTIRTSAGVILPTSGTVLVDGHDIVQDKVAACSALGWVPEFPNFEMNAKALSLMKYLGGYYGIGGKEGDEKARQLLELVGLKGFERRKLRDYSQGMKKRFALAVCMYSDPANYLFDEILNGLDPEGVSYFRSLMVEMRRQKKAVLLSSHILAEVESISDRVVVIHKSKIIKELTKEELGHLGEESYRITVDNLDSKALDYLKGVGEPSVDGKTVHLTKPSAPSAEINSGLVRMGYSVSELTRVNVQLEEYFFRLIGGANGK